MLDKKQNIEKSAEQGGQVDAIVMQTVEELCKQLGIELKGDHGQPYHCGERMNVKSGILGPDYAKCKCGLEIGNMSSPHINGGHILGDEWYQENGNATWIKLSV